MKRLVGVLLLLLALPVLNVNRLEWLLERWLATAVLTAAVGCVVAMICIAFDVTIRGIRRSGSVRDLAIPTTQRVA